MIMRAAAVLCIVATMVACGSKNDTAQINYMPVQLQGSNKWSILDVNTGKLVVKDAYTQTPSAVVNDMYYVMNDDGTFNYYNIKNPKIPVNKEVYGSVTGFSEDGLAVASKRGEALCVIDKNCEVVKELPKEVNQCSMFSRGMAMYQNDMGMWGYINTKGDTVISARYNVANPFVNEDLAIVVEPDLDNDSTASYSVINMKGEVQFNVDAKEFGMIQPSFIDGVLPLMKGDSIVCLNKKGEEVPSPNENYKVVEKAGYKSFARSVTGNFFVLNKDNKMGVVDPDNKVLVPAKFDRISDLRADRYIVGNDSVYSIIDDKGAPVGTVKFVHVHGTDGVTLANRGFTDTDLVAMSILGMIGDDHVAGVTIGTDLMTMNGALGDDAEAGVGQDGISMQQGPIRCSYTFDGPIATKAATDSAASFNYNAKVKMVNLSVDLRHCGFGTEETIVNTMMGAMGRCGFVMEDNNMFVSEGGNVLSMGYSQGILQVVFSGRADAKPVPREPRKK